MAYWLDFFRELTVPQSSSGRVYVNSVYEIGSPWLLVRIHMTTNFCRDVQKPLDAVFTKFYRGKCNYHPCLIESCDKSSLFKVIWVKPRKHSPLWWFSGHFLYCVARAPPIHYEIYRRLSPNKFLDKSRHSRDVVFGNLGQINLK